jgi:hypothetical protein
MVKIGQFRWFPTFFALFAAANLMSSDFSRAAEAMTLRNPQFTSESLLDGWELSVYGAQPEIVRDSEHEAGTGDPFVFALLHLQTLPSARKSLSPRTVAIALAGGFGRAT